MTNLRKAYQFLTAALRTKNNWKRERYFEMACNYERAYFGDVK